MNQAYQFKVKGRLAILVLLSLLAKSLSSQFTFHQINNGVIKHSSIEEYSTFQTLAVTSFTLVNASNEQDIQILSNGATLNLATLPSRSLNIRANTSPSKVPSVVFILSGKQSTSRTENGAPYALFGDNNGNYSSWTPLVGSYTLKATPYSASGGSGTTGTSLTINFNVIDQVATTQQVASFTLINADTEQPIQTLSNGSTLNLATLPSRNLNIRANTTPSTVGSVIFELSGAESKTVTENQVPYALYGDNTSKDYYAWTPSVGSYTLKATPYTASRGTGTAGTALTVNFQVEDVNGGKITGSLKKWQPITIDFSGPLANQSSTSPNPFLDYKLQVTFSHEATGRTYNIPGFFDGDGMGGASGKCWRVRFTPDESGTWKYAVSFRKGANIAIDLNQLAGSSLSPDGATGSFTMAPAEATAQGFLKRGRLEYANEFYLKCQDGSYWIKGGTDSPENFLALTFSNHIIDWQSGDPDWNNGQGKGIIGALNYLGSQNVNSIYFLPMNIGGDAQDTWPFVGPIISSGSTSNDNVHYDLNKLFKWEQIFSHAQKKGIMLHFVLNEAETANKQELDNATLDKERKLFYRELIARFGHHNALVWNLSEEYNCKLPIQPSMIKSWAQYIQDVDPYNHPITVHNCLDPNTAWTPFLGDYRFSVTSFQYAGSTAGRGSEVELWRSKTFDAGRPLPIYLDELRATTTSNMAIQRKEILWPTYFSGGAGIEYYFGSLDQSLQDFRPYESIWKWTWYARKFMEENIPFWQMKPDDGLLTGESTSYGGGQVFAKTGDAYAIYLPNASLGGTLNLGNDPGVYTLNWYNPRIGTFEGTSRIVTGGGNVELGTAPNTANEDWVVLLKNSNSAVSIAQTAPWYIDTNNFSGEALLNIQAKVIPNPTFDYFTLTIQCTNENRLNIKVFDALGRLKETRTGVPANAKLKFGQNYQPGVYYLEIFQQKKRISLMLFKQLH